MTVALLRSPKNNSVCRGWRQMSRARSACGRSGLANTSSIEAAVSARVPGPAQAAKPSVHSSTSAVDTRMAKGLFNAGRARRPDVDALVQD